MAIEACYGDGKQTEGRGKRVLVIKKRKAVEQPTEIGFSISLYKSNWMYVWMYARILVNR